AQSRGLAVLSNRSGTSPMWLSVLPERRALWQACPRRLREFVMSAPDSHESRSAGKSFLLGTTARYLCSDIAANRKLLRSPPLLPGVQPPGQTAPQELT